jgi:c-di-GMP-binding flagellar brake protein YcgR
MTGNVYTLYPLQVSLTDFKLESSHNTGYELLFVILTFVIIAAVVFIVNKVNKGGVKSKSGSGLKIFPLLVLHRLIKNVGLNHEQKKMLDFAFKTDEVTDPEKSLITPALLDRHFRRAYRAIEQSAKTSQEIQKKHAVLFSTRNKLENSALGAVSSTRQIREETALIVHYGKDKLELNVVSNNPEYLAVESPKNVLGSLVKIPKGAKLSVMFFTKSNKGFVFETRVSGYSNLHGHTAILLAHTTQIKFLSQRRYRRKQAVIACSLNLVYIEGSGKKQRLIVDKRRINGTINDISVGGCSLKISAPVQAGARFKIEFTQGNNNVAALGQVLRINRAGISTIIHIRFLRVTQKSMNLINAFVYSYTDD